MKQGHIIDTERLRIFEAVANTGSFTRAAAILGIAQSSVSEQIARLEERAGRLLLNRTTRRVELTPTGTAMLTYVRSILAMADDTQRLLGFSPPEGILKVGISAEYALTRLPETLGIFRKQHPRFQVQLLIDRGDRLFNALEEGKVDIILGKRYRSQTRGKFLWQEPIIWVGELHGKGGDPIPLAVCTRPSVLRDLTETALLAAHRTWTVTIEVDNLTGLIVAIKAGFGVTAMGQKFMPPELTQISSEDTLPALGTVDYVIDSSSSSPSVTAFCQLLHGLSLLTQESEAVHRQRRMSV